jgi:hypothetical protein
MFTGSACSSAHRNRLITAIRCWAVTAARRWLSVPTWVLSEYAEGLMLAISRLGFESHRPRIALEIQTDH